MKVLLLQSVGRDSKCSNSFKPSILCHSPRGEWGLGYMSEFAQFSEIYVKGKLDFSLAVSLLFPLLCMLYTHVYH